MKPAKVMCWPLPEGVSARRDVYGGGVEDGRAHLGGHERFQISV